MKKQIFLLVLILMAGCKHTKNNEVTYDSFVEHVRQTVENKAAPDTTFLGIKYNSTFEEKHKYLFWESLENERIWTSVSGRFKWESEGMTPEEQEGLYNSYVEKGWIEEICYIFTSKEGDKEAWGDFRLDSPEGIVLTFNWNDDDTGFYNIVVPFYKERYGEPGYSVTNADGLFHYWLTENSEVVTMSIDSELNFAVVSYEDAVKF